MAATEPGERPVPAQRHQSALHQPLQLLAVQRERVPVRSQHRSLRDQQHRQELSQSECEYVYPDEVIFLSSARCRA